MSLFVDEPSRRLRSAWVIAIFAGVGAGTFGVCNLLVGLFGLGPRFPMSLDDGYLFFNSLSMVIAAGVPSVVCALALKAEVGLPIRRAARDLPVGLVLGAAVVSLTVLIPVLAGRASLAWFSGPATAVALAGAQQLVTLGPTAVGEELMLRGVALRQLALGTRPWIAVVLTGACFGLMHLLNPSASGIAAANVALVGVWFGVLAIRSSLWTSIGAHVAWNWFEGFFYGQPVSGIESGHALLVGAVQPRGFLFGGDFGPEASGLTAVLLVVAIAVAVVWPGRPVAPVARPA